MLHHRNSNQDHPVDLYDPEGSHYYMEVPIDDEHILRQHYTAHIMPPPLAYTPPPPFLTTTTLTRENDEFIKSKCGMPIDTPPSPYLVVLGDEKIDLLLRDDLDTLLTGDREIDFNPSRDIEELERLLVNNHVPVPRVFDEPLGNSNLMSRLIETSDLILEELTTEIGLDDSIPTEIK
ncbi:hypothetical protein Tco_1131180 [Tanacetum coccineum]